MLNFLNLAIVAILENIHVLRKGTLENLGRKGVMIATYFQIVQKK